MFREKKQKTFNYRRAVFGLSPASGTLQQMVATALSAKSTLGKRRQSLGDPNSGDFENIVIGEFSSHNSFVFGVLFRYSPGAPVAVFLDDDTAQQASVKTFAVSTIAGGRSKSELINSAMYFIVIENNVVVMQSTAIRDRDLEEHLNWLLKQAKMLSDEDKIFLSTKPSIKAKDAIKRSSVRELVIDGDLMEPPTMKVIADDAQAAQLIARSAARKLSDKVWEAIKILVASGGDHFDLDNLDAKKVDFELKLKYEGRREENGDQALDRIGKVLRHIDGVDAKIVLDNGSVLKNDELRISKKVSIEYIDGVPDPTAVSRRMIGWLDKLHKSEEI